MDEKKIFGIVIRTVGLLMVLWGFMSLATVFMTAIIVNGLPHTESALAIELLIALAWIVIGIYFLRGARAIVRFAFPFGQY